MLKILAGPIADEKNALGRSKSDVLTEGRSAPQVTKKIKLRNCFMRSLNPRKKANAN
jgi:hypothetical protein